MEKTQTEENLIRGILRCHDGLLPAAIQELCEFVRHERCNALPADIVAPVARRLEEKKRAAQEYSIAKARLLEASDGAIRETELEKMLEEIPIHQAMMHEINQRGT